MFNGIPPFVGSKDLQDGGWHTVTHGRGSEWETGEWSG